MESRSPTAWDTKWDSRGFSMNWDTQFQMHFSCTQSTRLQTLHCRVLHRFIPTRRDLFIRRVIDSPICEYCSHEDILIHFMYQCACVRIIWDTMFDKMGTSKNENAMNAAALFGVPGGEDANNVVVL